MRALAFVLLLPAAGEATAEAPRPSYGFQMAEGTKSFSIPFVTVDQRIFVETRINGKGPFWFILDTGGCCIVSLEVARAIGLELEGEVTGPGAGEKVVAGRKARIAAFQVGAITLTELQVTALSLADSRHVFGGKPFHGVIGLPLLERMVVEIDYQKNRLTFTRPEHFVHSGRGTTLAFEREWYAPLVKAEIDGVPGRFALDTGSRSSILLNGAFADQHRLRSRYSPSVEAVTGWGFGGPIRSQVGRASRLTLGPIEVQRPLVLLSLQRGGLLATSPDAGLLGAGVLRRFNLVLDYGGQRITLVKNRNHGLPDLYDRSGMWISQSATGKAYEVFDVVADGPAARAGLKAGDQILGVDGRSAATLSVLDVRSRLKSMPSGRRVRAVVDSGGNRRDLVIVLRDLV